MRARDGAHSVPPKKKRVASSAPRTANASEWVMARWAKSEAFEMWSGQLMTSMSGKAAQAAAARHTRRMGGRC